MRTIRPIRRVISCVLALVVLVLGTVSFSACSSKGKPPALEDVYDRLVEVMEDSRGVNVILFGAGLPVYAREDPEDGLLHRYYGVANNGKEFVTPYAMYGSMEEMKAAAARVYGKAYRESLFESLFTGYADRDLSLVMPARYSQDEKSLYQNSQVEPISPNGVRVYDYSQMEILDGSHATYIRISIPSYTETTPGEWKTVQLSFVYEEGNWFLDSPSA